MTKKIRLMLTSIYFSVGLLIVLSTQLLGCTGSRMVNMSTIDIEKVNDKDEAVTWYKQELLKVNLEGLEAEEQATGEDRNERLIAELQFKVCGDSEVYFYCVQSADSHADLVAKDPEDWLSRAYLGSSYALKARDYPIQGLWQIIPGPGFVRLYYLNRAASHLNAAVEAKPKDPVIRLIRGSTFISMPGTSKNGHADMKLLLAWIADPSQNSENAELLGNDSFTNEVYYEYATSGKISDDLDVLHMWQSIADSDTPGHPILKLADIQLEGKVVSASK